MKYYIRNWYKIAVYIAGLVFMVALIGRFDFRVSMILASLGMIHLHFYEEMGYPGGFPYMGEHMELGTDDENPEHWSLNLATTAWGNEYFAVVVYILPIFIPQWHWMTLAVMLFAFIEGLMHGLFFTIKLRSFYDPGIITAVFGLTPIAIAYFIGNRGYGFAWYDYLIAIVWIGLNYWMAFKSPIYWKLAKLTQYSFGQDSLKQSLHWMRKIYK